jgi:hypothetical protein
VSEPDFLLVDVVKVALERLRLSDGKHRTGITLHCGGILVSGYVATQRDFLLSSKQTDELLEAYQQLSKRISEAGISAQMGTDDGLDYIHLSDARFFSPGQPPIPSFGEGVFWRGRLADVCGFHIGILRAAA